MQRIVHPLAVLDGNQVQALDGLEGLGCLLWTVCVKDSASTDI